MNGFVLLYYLVIGASSAALITGVTRSRGRVAGSAATVHDAMEAAFLSGGPARVTDSALAALAEDGRITVGGPGIVAVARPSAREPVERAVLAALAEAPSGALHLLRFAVMRSPAVQEIGDGLAARGLMAEPGAGRGWAVWGGVQAVVCFLGFPLAMLLTFATFFTSDGEIGVPFIIKVVPAVFGGIVVGMVFASRARRRVTGGGKDALAAYGRTHALDPSAAVRVALHGLRALPDPLLQAQLIAAARMGSGPGRRGRTTSASSSSSSSSSFYDPAVTAAVWCGAPGSGGSGCGSSSGGGGSSCGGGSGSSCSSGSSCGSSGSSCGGGSGSSCGSSSSSSCGSSSS
ncbi:TIGR04222 domain-containing membrane protein [Streptomyces sp. NPDC050738]|uniref:TIGR04222 domain-containing membrane protein n=1 Tax=Streptomyces sp. NPDC050738 TaxID=3154744 RepID=UPI003442AA3D